MKIEIDLPEDTHKKIEALGVIFEKKTSDLVFGWIKDRLDSYLDSLLPKDSIDE
nr:hypothetical protein [Candidatus Sigynarchaeota archaeon]